MSQNRNRENVTEEWYRDYYHKLGHDRNDLLSNPEVLYQHLATEDSVLSALRVATLDRKRSKILDVGCAGGGSLARFLGLKFRSSNLYGIDIQQDRIIEGSALYPNMKLICGDATSMPYESSFFDLCLESTMFVQLTDDEFAKEIANEMLRVTCAGGYILLIDWRYSKPWDPNYLGLSSKRIKKLFEVGDVTDLIYKSKGALVPPAGRFLSKYAPALYFLVRGLCPFLAGQRSVLLRKRG